MSEETKNRTNNGQWVKGQSGNPSGRPKVLGAVRDLAREHTEEAIKGLAEIARNAKAPAAARVSAWTALLDRGWGRPEQSMQITDERERFERLEYVFVDPPENGAPQLLEKPAKGSA